jgi:hypothetical protein
VHLDEPDALRRARETDQQPPEREIVAKIHRNAGDDDEECEHDPRGDRGSSQQGRSHQKRCKWKAEHRDERQYAEIAAAPDLHPKIGLLRIVDQIGVAPAKSPWIGRREDPTISYTLEQSLFDSFWHQHGQSPYDEAGHMLRPERETPLFRARHRAVQSPRNTS